MNDGCLSSNDGKIDQVVVDSKAIVSVSIEAQTDVGEIIKQISEFEEEISHIQEDALNVGALVDDSYAMLDINQDEHVMHEQLCEQSSNVGTFVDDSYVGIQSYKDKNLTQKVVCELG